jgi:purine-nucleoside phosphorylase
VVLRFLFAGISIYTTIPGHKREGLLNKLFLARVERVAASVHRLCDFRPGLGIITGSGLGGIVSKVEGTEISFSKIKDFPKPSVKGHPGLLKLGPQVAVCGGRIHAYEGYSAEETVLPVFLLHRLGVKKLILTNAAGGIRDGLNPGDLVLIRDQINLTGLNPLRGEMPANAGSRFIDMSDAYSLAWRASIKKLFPNMLEGVYAGLLGPSYETPAEIRMLEAHGADLVGMSTVLEAIAARFLGMELVGVSLVSNRAAGKSAAPLSHADVIATGTATAEKATALIGALIDLMARR